MKKFLRKWLEIENVNVDKIRDRLLRDIVHSAWLAQDIAERIDQLHTIRDTTDLRVRVAACVNDEKFIDDIVERIKRKQL